MDICDYPRVAVGGSTTAIRRHVVGENISISWVRHSGYGRKAAAHPQLLREQPLFLWGFPCLSEGLSSYVGAKTRLFLSCSILSFLEESWFGQKNLGLHRTYCNKTPEGKMIIIKNTCKILLCITCEIRSDALTCWNDQRQCHQQPKCYNYFQMKAKAASRLTFSFLLPGAVHS